MLVWWLFFALPSSQVWAASPTVTNVSATTVDGTYSWWNIISITVTFSENVNVTGTPTITLNTTPTARTWNYVSWSWTTTLTFEYTVMEWDTSADLDYASTTALALNGWTIQNIGGEDATLTLVDPWTAQSLWHNKDIVIDAKAPKVINVTSADNGTHSWWNIDITVEFDEIVFVTGTPTITLNTTPTARTWNYVSWSWTTTLTFRYTIESWDTSDDLDYASTTALVLNGWSIRDAATNDAVLALASPWTAQSLWYNNDIVIDAEKPTCTFTYNPTSWPVNTDVIATCTPSETVTYQRPLWTNEYTFTASGSYEFQFTDNAWNTWSSIATVDWIDTEAPTVTNVSATTADWYYKAWKDIDITVKFSETVYVTGTPTITLNTTPTARTWNYVSWSWTTTLTFRYTVMAWDYSDDLDYASTTALALNDWTIKDAATNNATLTLVATWTAWSLWANKAIVIDTEAPTLLGKTTFGTSWYTWDQTSTFTYTDNVWIVPWTPVTCTISTEWTASTCSVTPDVCDAAWNCNTTEVTSNAIKLDKTAPTFVSKNSFGSSWYNSNQTATFTYADDVAPIVSWTPVTCTITEWLGKTCTVDPNVCNEAWLCNTTNQTSNPANVDTSAPGAPTVTCSNFTHNTPWNYAWAITCTGTDTSWPSPLTKVEVSINGWASWIDNWTNLGYWFTPNEWTTHFMMRLSDTWWTWTPSSAYVIIKDITPPTVSYVTSSTSDGIYSWWNIDITVKFSENVNVTWTPAIRLGTTPTTRTWAYVSWGGTDELHFTYTITSWDTSADLDYENTTALVLNGWTIQDAATNNATLTLVTPWTVWSLWANKDIVIDTTPPKLTQVTPVPTPTNNTTPSYTFSSDEAGTITYGGSCSSTTTGAISWDNTITFNTLAEWTYSNCTIVVKDVAGNASNTLNVNTFMIDTTKPTCTFAYNPTSWTIVNTDVVATCTPSEPVTYQQPSWTGVYTFTTNGSYEFQFTDNAWNTWSSTATVDWIDKTAPVVTLNGSTTMTVTRWWTFTDPWASWEDNVDGTGTITTANSGTVDAGTIWTYILEYRHTDTAWNKSDTVTRTVTVRVKKVTSSKEEQLSTGQTEPEVLDDETSEKTLDELVGDYMEKYKDNPEKLKQLETAMKSAKDSDVDQELKDAYVYAFLNGITTQATIEKAELDRGITRAEMAKMMAVFATKISDKERVKTGIVKYADVDSSLGDLADYILLAYQLQIMGIDANGNPIENFNPHAEVTRAEFATVLSRILYGNKYNQQGSDFYSKHLQALKNASILKNTTPTMKELRGWVMLMLYRS